MTFILVFLLIGTGGVVYEDRQHCLSLNDTRWTISQGCEWYKQGEWV